MGFPFLPKLVTLNDLDRRNGCYLCVISPNSVEANYVKVAEVRPRLLAT